MTSKTTAPTPESARERCSQALEALQRGTSEKCLSEFAPRWDEPFFAPGGLADGGIGAWLVEKWDAECKCAQLETEARELYDRARRKIAKLGAELRTFREHHSERGTNIYLAGGVGCQALYLLEGNLAAQLETCRPITEFEEHLSKKGLIPPKWKRRDKRSALVALLEREANRPPMNHGPKRELSNRDIAVISLLVGCGPEDQWGGPNNRWAAYERKLLKALTEDPGLSMHDLGKVVTPAQVIEEEAHRVDRLRS